MLTFFIAEQAEQYFAAEIEVYRAKSLLFRYFVQVPVRQGLLV